MSSVLQWSEPCLSEPDGVDISWVPYTGGTRPPEVRDAQSVRLLQGWASASALSSGTVFGSLGGRGPGLGHTLQELSGELSCRMTTKQIFATRTSKRVKEELPDAAARYLWPRLGVDQQTGERDIEA